MYQSLILRAVRPNYMPGYVYSYTSGSKTRQYFKILKTPLQKRRFRVVSSWKLGPEMVAPTFFALRLSSSLRFLTFLFGKSAMILPKAALV